MVAIFRYFKRIRWVKSYNAERDPGFRQELGTVARRGLGALGVLIVLGSASWLSATVFVFGKRATLSFAEDSDPLTESVGLHMSLLLLGALVILVSRIDVRLSLLRLWGALALLSCAALIHTHELIGFYHSAELHTETGLLAPAALNIIYFMLIFLIGAGTMPLHPFHTLALGLSLSLEYSVVDLIIQSSIGFTPQSVHSGALTWMIIVTVLHAGMSGLLYANRWRLYLTRRREQRLRAGAEELNKKLRQTQVQLVQSSKMAALGDLIAGVAHEINTPLGSIKGSADVAQRAAKRLLESEGVKSNDSLSRYQKALNDALTTLDQGVTRVDGVVSNLRKFARLDEADTDVVNLEECIEETLSLLEYRITDNLVINRSYGGAPKVLCSPRQINQVFLNLLMNAFDALPDGGIITIGSRHNNTSVTIEIHDNGPGIAKENLSRVFDPGFTTKGVGVGVGLGLSICYQVIKDHDGEISITSERGQGARAIVSIPRRLSNGKL